MPILDQTGPLNTVGHTAFLAALTQKFGPDHAALFAVPTPHPPNQTLWIKEGQNIVPFRDLPETTRLEVLRYVGTALSDIRRMSQVEEGDLRRLFPQARRIPSFDCIYVVDSRPVLSQWGLATTQIDPLAAYDDGQFPLIQQTRLPTHPSLLVSGLAGALLGLCLACILTWFSATTPYCASVPHPAASEHIAVNELPQGAWEQHDLSVMKGCWFRISNMKTENIQSSAVQSVAKWTFCFSEDGSRGQQHLTYTDGSMCTGPISAAFENDTLAVKAERCYTAPHTFLVRTIFRCTRGLEGQAICPGHDADPAVPDYTDHKHKIATGVFQREAP
ncbi:hypothetical protein HKD28_10650 [Gluconobacter sp. LMG 1744]|uniref:hypothetical protein n=1 Tax=Gluconobacter TaxID=441 RepID=UPI00098A9CB0|nr:MULTISPECIES: hypothetical protein [Gluconobacter]AQS92410.1 hypothetical protein A0U94_14660 [Gluconobacter albidus]MBF0891860.1 hypothetical protein [Gluconobacter cadivus]MBS1092473.1 hypothetical protein [Gluconobacter sp. Dm-74]